MDVIKVLMEYKANIEARDQMSRTPLLIAAFKGCGPALATPYQLALSALLHMSRLSRVPLLMTTFGFFVQLIFFP